MCPWRLSGEERMRQTLFLPVGPWWHRGNIISFLYFMDSKPLGVKFSHSQTHLGATCKVICPFHDVPFYGKRTSVGQEFLTSWNFLKQPACVQAWLYEPSWPDGASAPMCTEAVLLEGRVPAHKLPPSAAGPPIPLVPLKHIDKPNVWPWKSTLTASCVCELLLQTIGETF